jgi:hypothetical protein
MPSHASCKSWIARNLGHANVAHNSKFDILFIDDTHQAKVN